MRFKFPNVEEICCPSFFANYCKTNFMGKKILLALSGGPDSVLLFYLLKSCSKSIGFEFEIFYFNHNIRKISIAKREANFVKALCDFCAVKLFYKEVPQNFIKEKSKEVGKSLEEFARELRYSELFLLKAEYGFDYIVTAHHKDDQLETLLMRFLGGSGSEGLQGIYDLKNGLARPLLPFTKQEILSFLHKYKIPFLFDHTNKKNFCRRNIIRNKLMPTIKKYFPEASFSILSGANKMELQHEANQFYLRPLVSQAKADKNLWIPINLLFTLPLYLQIQLIFELYNIFSREVFLATSDLGLANNFFKIHSVPFAMVKQALLNLASGYKNNQQLFKFEGVGLVTSYKDGVAGIKFVASTKLQKKVEEANEIIFETDNLIQKLKEGNKISGLFINGKIDYTIFISLRPTRGSGVAIPFCEIEKAREVVIRTKREGDFIETLVGTKKVKKIFCDWKMETGEKEICPVVLVDKKVASVAGKVLGYADVVASDFFKAGSEKWLLILFQKCC